VADAAIVARGRAAHRFRRRAGRLRRVGPRRHSAAAASLRRRAAGVCLTAARRDVRPGRAVARRRPAPSRRPLAAPLRPGRGGGGRGRRRRLARAVPGPTPPATGALGPDHGVLPAGVGCPPGTHLADLLSPPLPAAVSLARGSGRRQRDRLWLHAHRVLQLGRRGADCRRRRAVRSHLRAHAQPVARVRRARPVRVP